MWSRLAFIGAFLILLTDVTAVVAADPPGRVARLSLTEGTVSLRSPQLVGEENAADNANPQLKDEWAPATLNYPVTSGNSLWTETGGKAEIQAGPAEVRLDEQTELEVLRLDDRSVDLALHQGTANVHIGDAMPGGLLIDTPRGPVTLTRPGSYRIDVDTGNDKPADIVQVTAFDGEAKISVETPERTDAHTVARGQSFKLSGEPVEIALADARATAFDDWARRRDSRAVATAPRSAVVSPSAPQMVAGSTVSPVSTQITGYQDLAPYGTWEPTPNYGTVWYPATVTPDWAPYRYGHWAYVAPWGWTWIDDAPWGFTPFHYGRWVRIGPRWAWWPGHRTIRPVYAPALVAFIGSNGWSVAVTSGRARPVGWVPLAPFEVYRPHYRTSATYVRNVNITTVNKTVINNITVNNNTTEINRFANRNAVTAVTAENFARSRKVNEVKLDLSRKDLDRAKATNDVRAIRPAAGATKAEQPRWPARNEDGREGRRAPNPAIAAPKPERSNRGLDPAIERRNAAIQAAPKNAAQPQQRPPQAERPDSTTARNKQREERRDAMPQLTPPNVPTPVKEAHKEAVREPAAASQAQPQHRREQRRDQVRERRREEGSNTQPVQPQKQPQVRQQAQDQQRS